LHIIAQTWLLLLLLRLLRLLQLRQLRQLRLLRLLRAGRRGDDREGGSGARRGTWWAEARAQLRRLRRLCGGL
jgi:hypothetical protein